MNYGLYLSAAGTLKNMHRQDVIANNLANVNTVGFKPDMVFSQQRMPARLEQAHLLPADPRELLERLGGGNFIAPTYVDTTQGALQPTGRDLDIAVNGEGFFIVAGANPADSSTHRLTRDGRLSINADNQLIMASNGMRVLDVNNQPITVNPSMPLQIDGDGVVRQDGRIVGELKLVSVDDPGLLHKVGDNLLAVHGEPNDVLKPALGRVQQGAIEQSASNPITMLNQMIGATKSAQGNAKMMQYHDFMLGQAISTFGRVA